MAATKQTHDCMIQCPFHEFTFSCISLRSHSCWLLLVLYPYLGLNLHSQPGRIFYRKKTLNIPFTILKNLQSLLIKLASLDHRVCLMRLRQVSMKHTKKFGKECEREIHLLKAHLREFSGSERERSLRSFMTDRLSNILQTSHHAT